MAEISIEETQLSCGEIQSDNFSQSTSSPSLSASSTFGIGTPLDLKYFTKAEFKKIANDPHAVLANHLPSPNQVKRTAPVRNPGTSYAPKKREYECLSLTREQTDNYLDGQSKVASCLSASAHVQIGKRVFWADNLSGRAIPHYWFGIPTHSAFLADRDRQAKPKSRKGATKLFPRPNDFLGHFSSLPHLFAFLIHICGLSSNSTLVKDTATYYGADLSKWEKSMKEDTHSAISQRVFGGDKDLPITVQNGKAKKKIKLAFFYGATGEGCDSRVIVDMNVAGSSIVRDTDLSFPSYAEFEASEKAYGDKKERRKLDVITVAKMVIEHGQEKVAKLLDELHEKQKDHTGKTLDLFQLPTPTRPSEEEKVEEVVMEEGEATPPSVICRTGAKGRGRSAAKKRAAPKKRKLEEAQEEAYPTFEDGKLVPPHRCNYVLSEDESYYICVGTPSCTNRLFFDVDVGDWY